MNTATDTLTDTAPTPTRSLAELYTDARAEIAGVDGLDRFARMIEELRANAHDFKVAIAERRDAGTLAHVRSVPYAGFDEDELARQCGPGHYRLTLKDAGNRIVTNCEVRIAAGSGPTPDNTPRPAPQAGPDRLARLESLVENLIERRPTGAAPGLGEIAQLIQACRPAPTEGLSIKDLLTTVTTIVPLIAGRASPVKDIIEGMRAVRDLSGDGAESDSASLVQSILGALASMAQQQRPTMRATPAEPAPPAPRRVPQSPPAPTAPPAPGTAAAPTPPTPPPAPRPAETGLVSMLAAPVGKAIVFGAMSGIAPENLAPAVIDLIDASADAGTVPADQAGLCQWLIAQLPPDASDMVPVLTAYIGELAEAIGIEISADDDGHDEQLQDDIDENGRPRSGDPMYAPLTTEEA